MDEDEDTLAAAVKRSEPAAQELVAEYSRERQSRPQSGDYSQRTQRSAVLEYTGSEKPMQSSRTVSHSTVRHDASLQSARDYSQQQEYGGSHPQPTSRAQQQQQQLSCVDEVTEEAPLKTRSTPPLIVPCWGTMTVSQKTPTSTLNVFMIMLALSLPGVLYRPAAEI